MITQALEAAVQQGQVWPWCGLGVALVWPWYGLSICQHKDWTLSKYHLWLIPYLFFVGRSPTGPPDAFQALKPPVMCLRFFIPMSCRDFTAKAERQEDWQ